MNKTYLENAVSLLIRDYNRGGLDLSKEVLWVFVDQRTFNHHSQPKNELEIPKNLFKKDF